jgi:hypothetical protein
VDLGWDLGDEDLGPKFGVLRCYLGRDLGRDLDHDLGVIWATVNVPNIVMHCVVADHGIGKNICKGKGHQ